MSNIKHNPNSEDEISIKDIVTKIKIWRKFILSKWIIIVMSGFIGGVLGLAYAYMQEPIYTAESTFVLEDSKGGGMLSQLGGLASLAGISGGGNGGGLFEGDNIIQLYKSRSMLEKTLLSEISFNGKKELLIDNYINFKGIREKWKKNPKLANLNFDSYNNKSANRLQDSVLGVFVRVINMKHLTVNKPDKKLSIIKVETRSENEFFSKTFNDLIVRNVNDFYVQTKTKKANDNLAIVQHQTDSVRNVLVGAIYSTATVTDATPNLNQTRQILRAPAQRSQYNAETNMEILKQLVQNLELAKLSLRQETPLIQVIDYPILPLKKEGFGKTKGLLLGGVLFGFIALFFVVVKKIYIDILNEE